MHTPNCPEVSPVALMQQLQGFPNESRLPVHDYKVRFRLPNPLQVGPIHCSKVYEKIEFCISLHFTQLSVFVQFAHPKNIHVLDEQKKLPMKLVAHVYLFYG